jgi:hypothetical protein
MFLFILPFIFRYKIYFYTDYQSYTYIGQQWGNMFFLILIQQKQRKARTDGTFREIHIFYGANLQ